jgi:hypothetical protein
MKCFYLLGAATPSVVAGMLCLVLQNLIFLLLALVIVVEPPELDPSWRLLAVGSDVTKTLEVVTLRQTTLGPVGIDFYNNVGHKIFSAPSSQSPSV